MDGTNQIMMGDWTFGNSKFYRDWDPVYREVEILGPSALSILTRVQGKMFRNLGMVDKIRILWYAWNWENAMDVEIIK